MNTRKPLDLPPITDGKPTTFGQLFARGWANFYENAKSLKTHESEARCILRDLDVDTPLDGVTTERIDLLIQQWRTEGASSGTVNRRLSMISRILRWAWKRGWLPVLPYIERLREPRGRQRWVKDDELRQVIDLVPANVGDLFVLLANTGMRLGEALSLEWPAVDLKRREVHLVETKSGYPRTVPLNENAYAALENRLGDPRPFDGLYTEKVCYWWRQARRKMGLEHDKEFVVHALRHRAASLLVQKGVHIAVVRELLGHRKLETTMRYTHLDTQQLVDAVERLG